MATRVNGRIICKCGHIITNLDGSSLGRDGDVSNVDCQKCFFKDERIQRQAEALKAAMEKDERHSAKMVSDVMVQ
jgi:hypothetical protein